MKKNCRVCDIILTASNISTSRLKYKEYVCKECIASIKTKQYLGFKQKILSNYGGKCNSCGEDNIYFLTIDHINNDGNDHRKKIGEGSQTLYRWIKNNNYPKIFTVLCYNCNYKKHKNNLSLNLSNEKKAIVNRNSLAKLKYKILNAYGTACKCCGIDDISVLTIDHINNNGAAHRIKIGKSSHNLHRWMIKNNYPQEFQILCFNCNAAKRNNKMCPHKLEKYAGVFDFLKPKTEPKIPEKPQEKEVIIPPQRVAPIKHNIPEGRVDKKYNQFPILQAITPDKIRVTPNAGQHISSIFVKRLYDVGLNADRLDDRKLIDALRNAIIKGYILYNYPSDDPHNPLDRQLELFSYIDLSQLDPSYKGIAKFKILCRLSLTHGTLSVRTIQKNFPVE